MTLSAGIAEHLFQLRPNAYCDRCIGRVFRVSHRHVGVACDLFPQAPYRFNRDEGECESCGKTRIVTWHDAEEP